MKEKTKDKIITVVGYFVIILAISYAIFLLFLFLKLAHISVGYLENNGLKGVVENIWNGKNN